MEADGRSRRHWTSVGASRTLDSWNEYQGALQGESRSMLSSLQRSELIDFLRNAARSLTSTARRKLQANACQKFAHGSPRFAEFMFGWNRSAGDRGLREQFKTEFPPNCDSVSISDRSTHAPKYSGRPRIEQRNPSLLEATRRSLDDKTQADPKLRGSKLYTRMTGQFLRLMLAEDLGIAVEQLPSTRSMRPITTWGASR